MIKDGNLHELHLMAGGGEEREVRLILSRGVDVNLPDEDGWTPLHWACYRHEVRPLVKSSIESYLTPPHTHL